MTSDRPSGEVIRGGGGSPSGGGWDRRRVRALVLAGWLVVAVVSAAPLAPGRSGGGDPSVAPSSPGPGAPPPGGGPEGFELGGGASGVPGAVPAAPPSAHAPRRRLPGPAGPGPETPAATPLPPAPAAARLAGAVEAGLADPRFAGTTVGLSVWVDGLGEVAVHNGDLPLNPASNQKLYVAMAALALLPPGAVFTTEVRAVGALEGSTLDGELVLVGGGDPTLRSTGRHSLDALAAAVRRRGIERVTGALVGDETRYDRRRSAPGWLSWHVPRLVGPLSALAVDGNQHRDDAAFAAEPLLANLQLFRAALRRHGVTVSGPEMAGSPQGGTVVASLASAPMAEVVRDMLLRSDNTAAELLLKEIGFRLRGAGSTEAGVAAADGALRSITGTLMGVSRDGSGLSRLDRRSAREWRRLLQAARSQPWGPALLGSLPVAGRTGTLASRLRGTAAESNLRAKTGRILEGRALSGYLRTAGGRRVVFSVIVNGTTPRAPVTEAIDALVARLSADRS